MTAWLDCTNLPEYRNRCSARAPDVCPSQERSYNHVVDFGSGRHPHITTLGGAFFTLVLLLLLLHPQPSPFLDALRQGDTYTAQMSRTLAVDSFHKAARLRPQDPLPYLRMAQVYLDWGRAEEALAAATVAQRLGADPVDSGRVHLDGHVAGANWGAAADVAVRLLAQAPTDTEVRQVLAFSYIQLREWDLAEVEYRTLLQQASTNEVAHEQLGALLLGYDPRAEFHLSAAGTDLADQLIEAWAQSVVSEDPAYGSALVGRVLTEARRWGLAARQLERALAYSPDYGDAHAYLGYALDQLGYVDEAARHLERAVLIQDTAVARTFLGLHHRRQGDPAAARAEFEVAYDLDPGNPATCVEIGQTWTAERRYVAAEIWLKHAVSLQPDDPALWEILARFYIDHNISVEVQGIQAVEHLLVLSPGDAVANDLRGWAAFQIGDYDAAEEHLRRAIVGDPSLAAPYFHLGKLFLARGEVADARDAFIRTLDLDKTGALVPDAELVPE